MDSNYSKLKVRKNLKEKTSAFMDQQWREIDHRIKAAVNPTITVLYSKLDETNKRLALLEKALFGISRDPQLVFTDDLLEQAGPQFDSQSFTV
jgi:hypothetical protein